MIRFILKRHRRFDPSMQEMIDLETLDAHAKELEDKLRHGGSGDGVFDYAELIGAEVRDDPPPAPERFAVCVGGVYEGNKHLLPIGTLNLTPEALAGLHALVKAANRGSLP